MQWLFVSDVLYKSHLQKAIGFTTNTIAFCFVSDILYKISLTKSHYGVATISRMLKNIGLFCKRALQKRPVLCKETCIFKHPTNRSHPIAVQISLTKSHWMHD